MAYSSVAYALEMRSRRVRTNCVPKRNYKQPEYILKKLRF